LPVSLGWAHFKERRGMITGLIMCGFGFGASFFVFLSTYLVNPNNIKPSDDLYP
jgi:hypothetical protein